MKRFLFVLLAGITLQYGYAQRSVIDQSPQRLFKQGKEMFVDNNYAGCIHSLNEFKRMSKDAGQIAEADYMIVSSSYYQGSADAEYLLKDYLENNPATYHRNQLCFFIGSLHFNNKEWSQALLWLSQSNVDYLSEKEQEDHTFRIAQACLHTGNKKEARSLFGILTRISEKYSEPSSYYLAYIDFQNGDYERSLPVFQKLRNNPEYKENATFLIIQGSFLQGDLQETISAGKEYAALYPRSKNAAEVYRLLGSSHYQLGDLANSIVNYERYLQYGEKPFREDMFQLGTAYYKNGVIKQAIEALKMAASTDDQLGQAAYMLLGQSYISNNDNTNALMSFDAAARCSFDKTISENALYNYVLLACSGTTGAFDQSVSTFQRFLAEYPDSKYKNEVSGLFANTLLSTKNYDAALSTIAAIKSPDNKILEAKQMILFQLGTENFINGNYQNSISRFNECINMGTHNMDVRNEAYFWRGEAAYRTGAYSDAANDYTRYLSQAKSSQNNYALAMYNLGYAKYQVKDYNAALNNFRKYVQSEKNRQLPNFSDALNRIGDCYLFNRNYAEAERYYAQAVNTNPSAADYAEFQKAYVMGLQRNYAGKANTLDAMMSRYPDSEYVDDALFEKSRALVMLNRENEAISALEKLLLDHPKSNLAAQTGVQLGQLYFNVNNPQKSIAVYKNVIASYPNTEESRISIKSLEGVYRDINDISSYASYVNSLGGGVSISTNRQDSLTFLAAENVYMKGQKEQAKTSFAQYLQSYPNGAFAGDANFYLGYIAFEAKDSEVAYDHFGRVIATNNPKYINDALIYNSGIAFDRKDYEAAYSIYEHLDQVANSAENKSVGQLGMLRSASIMQRDHEVVAAAGKLLDNAKTSPEVADEARFYRAKSLTKLDRTNEALADYEIVAKDTRTAFGAESQFILADTYYKTNDYDKATKQVLDFMKQGSPHAYWLARSIIVLSDVYVTKGDTFQARQYLENLKVNYTGNEIDIQQIITDKLSAIENR